MYIIWSISACVHVRQFIVFGLPYVVEIYIYI